MYSIGLEGKGTASPSLLLVGRVDPLARHFLQPLLADEKGDDRYTQNGDRPEKSAQCFKQIFNQGCGFRLSLSEKHCGCHSGGDDSELNFVAERFHVLVFVFIG